MIKYGDLVKYIKENHVNWNEDLFDVLRGFFEQYSQTPHSDIPFPIQQEILFPSEEFKEPDNGEYSAQDVMNLFSQ
jgi:hypothetical protein